MTDIILVPLNQIIPDNENPRTITRDQFAKLCDRMEKDPEYIFARPLMVELFDGKYHIYAGNQRYRAAKKLSWSAIPCHVSVDLDPVLRRQRMIADNVTMGEHDWDMLSAISDPAELLELGMVDKMLHLGDIDEIETDDKPTKKKRPKECPNCGHEL